MRSALLVLAVVAVLAGCDRVLGIDHLDDDAAPGAEVTGKFGLRYVRNDQNHQPVTLDMTYSTDKVHADVTLEDGMREAVLIGADGTFAFPRASASQRYSLSIATPFSSVRFQLANAHLDLVEWLVGRPDRLPVPANTTVTLALSNRPGGFEGFLSSGVWMNRLLIGGESNKIPVSTFGSLSGPIGLLSATEHDSLYFVGYVAAGTPAYAQLATFLTWDDATLNPGADSMFSGTASTLLRASCARLVASRKAETNRLAQVMGGTVTDSSAGVNMLAAPGTEIGAEASFLLTLQGQGATTGIPISDTTQDTKYENPFPGYATIVTMTTQVTDGVSTYDSRIFVGVPGSTCNDPPVMLDAGLVSVPTAAKLDGVAFAANNQSMMLEPMKDPQLTWALAGGGSVDYFVVRLGEVVASTFVERAVFVTTDPRVDIPRSLLVTGRTYQLQINTRTGTPGAASGDFTARNLPRGAVELQTPTFVVQ